MKKVLFIASTGGHLSELMQLKPLFESYDYHIITSYSMFYVFVCLENFLCDELESISFMGLVNLR